MNSRSILVNQLPYYFRPIIEFQEIMKAHGWALDQLDSSAAQIYANNYLSTCDEETLAFWEGVLGITYRFGDTLEFRRQRVLQKFNTFVPFTYGFLKEQLDSLYGPNGYTLSVNSKECTLSIQVTSDRYGAVDLLYDLLWDVVPAHIQIIANQQTTTDIGGSKLYVAGFLSNTLIQTI